MRDTSKFIDCECVNSCIERLGFKGRFSVIASEEVGRDGDPFAPKSREPNNEY